MNCDRKSNNGNSTDKTEIDSFTKEKIDSSVMSEALPSALKRKEQIDEEEKNQEKTTQDPKRRSQLFYLISAGSATGQQFLFNFFSAFAVLVGVTPVLLGFITSIRNLMSSLFQGTIGKLSDKMGRR